MSNQKINVPPLCVGDLIYLSTSDFRRIPGCYLVVKIFENGNYIDFDVDRSFVDPKTNRSTTKFINYNSWIRSGKMINLSRRGENEKN